MSNVWYTWFLDRQFKNWVRDNNYGEVVDELIADFNKYGTCVSKKVGDTILRVPLRSLRNDQSAKSLMESVKGGVPVIEEHNYSFIEMQEYKNVWEIPDYFDGKRCVYEMYSYVKKEELFACQGKDMGKYDGKGDEMVLTMAILMPSGKETYDKRKKYEERILFIEQIDKLPYDEGHNERQDGRWLSVGEVEKQLENQIARNVTTNLRRRAMFHASRNIYQTQGDVIAKNLVKEVQDGDVMQVGMNGALTRIDTSTRSLSDFSQDDQVWESNSEKQSFAFESATGEGFASGTPFRLGAMLSNSVMNYFDGKRDKLGFFLKETFYSKMIPIFQKRSKDDILVLSQSEDGYNNIKALFTEMYTNNHYAQLVLSPDYFDKESLSTIEQIKIEVENNIIKSPFIFVQIPKQVYKNAKYTIDLNLTNESRSPADVESDTTLYSILAQNGDPRAEKVLERLLASRGKNINSIAGVKAPNMQQPQSNPDLQGLTTQ